MTFRCPSEFRSHRALAARAAAGCLVLLLTLLAVPPASASVPLVPDGPWVEVGDTGVTLEAAGRDDVRVVMAADGSFTVLWRSARAGFNSKVLFARSFEAGGVPRGEAREIVIGFAPRPIYSYADVAMDSAGRLLLAWDSFDAPAAGWRLYGTDGSQLQQVEIQPDPPESPDEEPALIRDITAGLADDGTVVVAWMESAEQFGTTVDSVVVQRFEADGDALGERRELTSRRFVGELDLAVAPGGAFAVAWVALAEDGTTSGVQVARFDTQGELQTGLRATPRDHDAEEFPSLALNGAGEPLLTFSDPGQSLLFAEFGDCAGVYAVPGILVPESDGEELRVDSDAEGCRPLAVAGGLEDGWAVAWKGGDSESYLGDGEAHRQQAPGAGLWLRTLGEDGSPAGPPLRVMPTLPRSTFAMATRGDRGVVAAAVPRRRGDSGSGLRVVVQRLARARQDATAETTASLCEQLEDRNLLCVRDGRFRIDADWRDPYARPNVPVVDWPTGAAQAHYLYAGEADAASGRSGALWFFAPDNLEMLVKVLNGGPVNGFDWVFYGSLTTVEFWLNVTDLESGHQSRYYNPPFLQESVADDRAFPLAEAAGVATSSVAASTDVAAPDAAPGRGVIFVPARNLAAGATAEAGCVPADTRLCLQDRFAVTVEWEDPRTGDRGVGHALPQTSDTGAFWFFRRDNAELLLKVLDGRSVNGHWWVFYAGLSDVGFTVTVTPLGGEPVTYTNEPFTVGGAADTEAISGAEE